MDQTDTRGAPRIHEHYALWRGVRVTDATFSVGDRAYDITELRRLREQPGRPQPARQRVLGLAVAQAAVVVIALVGLTRLDGATTVLYVGGAMQAVATTVLVGLALMRWPTPIELWAVYHGEPTMLYRAADRYEFGKVERAVQRAMLSHRLLK